MKKTTIISSLFLFGSVLLLPLQAFAAEGDQATSQAKIEFKENDKTTDPKDPKDPSKKVDPTDPDQPITTGQNGPLSLDVIPSYDFGTQVVDLAGGTYKAGTKVYQNYLQVTDNRTNANGWTITVKRSTFKDSTSGDTIDGTTLTIPAGTVRNSIPTAEQNNAGGVTTPVDDQKIASPEVGLIDDQEVNIFGTKEDNAKIGKGTTTSLLGETTDALGTVTVKPATLKVPAGVAKVGNFEATLTWTTTAGVFS